MKRHSWLYVISAISVALAVFQPVVDAAQTDEPEPPTTGDLVIYLVGSDGATLDGCFSVTDADGVNRAECSSGGAATVSGLAVGTASVTQTSGPEGYELAAPGSAEVPAGGVGEVTLTATYIPPPPTPTPVPPTPTPPPPTPTPTLEPTVEPTPEPTEGPTEAPSEEPTEQPTEAPTEIPEEEDGGFGVFAAGDITLDCQHTSGQTTTTFSVSAEDIPGDVQPFSITIVPYDLQGNQLPAQEFVIPPTEQPIVFEDVEWRRIDVTVQFSDGSSSTAAAGCNNDALPTDITTSPQTTDGTSIPDGGSLEPGTAMIDTATLSGQSLDAAGTVTYYLYDSADCSGDPVFTSGPLDVVNGEVPSSAPYTPTGSGQYEWVVVYSGDIDQGDPTQNSNFNSPAESGCGEETVIVGQLETELTTSMQTADGATIPQAGTIPQGTDVLDTATLSGATGNAGGTVTYTLFEGACPGTPVDGATFTVDVTDGVVPPSGVVSDLPAGTYNWVVTYSGDDQNLESSSDCGEETFTVGKAQPTVTTNMFDTDDNEIADGAVVPVGTSMYDTATIDGFAEPLTGTVTFALYDSADCTGTPVAGPFETTIGPLGGIDPSDVVELSSTGTYNWVVTYSGNDANESASSDCGSETVNVEPASPTITTEIFNAADDSVIDPGSVVDADSTVYDTATLDGATDDATGTVTFSLYNNFTCTGTPYFTVTVPLNDDGTIPPTPPVGPLPGGTWNWTASYSGDENNNPASTACGDEEFFIGQGQGGITTMVEDESGTDYPDGSQVEVDTVLRDTAVLDGVTPDAGGSVTFYLYEGADCSGDLVFTSDPVPVVDGELQGPSGTFTFVDQGTYQWVAVYSGDENNASVSSPCGAETIVVVGKPSSVTTAMFTEDGTEIANNDRVLSGTSVYDTATVSPEEATGTLTYELYNNANCSGTPIELFEDVPVGNPSPLVSEPTPGVYNWVVTYSGDAEYAESVSACSTETFYIALQPSITTLMVDENGDEIPNNSTIQAGDFIGDTAELVDSTDDASGTVTYYFYDSADCTGTPVFAPQVTVANGEVPPSGVFQPPFTGEWSIQAEYSGDNTNFPAVSECGTENFVVDPESAVTIWTTMRADGEVIPHESEIRFLPATVTDSVTVLGIPDGTTGDVTFELYKSEDCSGAPVFTDSYEDVVASAESGWSLTSQPFPLAVEDWGTYNWVVTASGDVDGDGQPESIASECGEETFTGVSENPRTVDIQCTYNSQTQLTTFRVLVAKPTTADPDIDPNLIVVATPTDNFLNPLDPITYHAYDSSNPDSGVNFVQQPWRQLTVQVTWPDGQTGAAFANCNTNTLSPELTTDMFAVATTPIENGETVEIGTQVYDTATLTGGTTRWSGELTYTLYQSEDCASGTEVGSPQVFTLNPEDTTLPPSDPVTVTFPGTYNWVVSYSGDQNNNPATSGCGEEFFQIEPLDVTVLTEVVLDETGAAVPDDGVVPVDSSIHDMTVLDGALDTVTGEVTYTLYSTDDCSGDPAFTETVTIANGAVPPSSSVTVDNVGTWNWMVSYGGDDFHNPATSACGDETVQVEQATPAITTDLSVDETSAGDEVFDTATMTGASGNAGGEVTYYVYTTDDCSGDPLYTLGPVTVENGVVPDSPPQVFDTPGHYEWQAVYTGDANNVGATSVCGTEPLDIVAPDVVVDKTVGVTPIVAGEDARFTITVSNIGQGNAYDVVVIDDLPAGIDWTIDPAVDGCAITDGSLECSFDTLVPGESVDITVTGTTDAEDCGFMINVASATASNEPDDATGNNQDASLLRVDCPNIRVLKVADPAEVTATDPVSFTIEVRNIGLGRADNVQLVDDLPADLAPWTIDPAVDGCEIADGVSLTCDIGSLERGEAFSVTVVGTSDTEDCGVIANEASATADNESDGATGNNTDEAQVQILCAEMVVTKSASSGVVSAGEDVSYTVTATNNGAGIAYNAVVTDELPAGLVWSETPDNPNCEIAAGDPQVLTCDFGDMAPGATNSVTVTATTDAADCGVLANRAEVESSSDDANNDISNTESRVVEIDVFCPDILVEKTAGTDVVSAGDDVSFTIAVTNAGEGIATDVEVEDELPAGIEWAIDPAVDGCAITDGTLNCAFDAIGPLETIEITVTGTTDAADCGVLTNTATGTAGNEPDDATGNNSAIAEITVDCPDIVVEKARSGVPVLSAGDDVSFTVTVSNTGAGDAHDVTVTDDLPEGIEWAIDPAVDGCAIADGSLSCTFATLPAGASVDITVTGTTDAADCGLLPNTASATASNEADDATDNNSDSAIVLVQCPDVVVEKTTTTPDVSAGDDVSFTITVSNDGSGDANDVVVTDALPAGVEWTIAPPVEGCAIADGTLECSFDTLASGESVSITVTGTTDAADCGTLENLASAESSNESGDDTDNNSANAAITVNCPDILVEKTTTTPVVSAGDEVNFTVTVSNIGEGTAHDVIVSDELPAGIFWAESPDNPDCSISADGLTLTCEIAELEPGASSSVTVTGTTDAANCGVLTNTANAAASNESDADQFPNEAEASITVNCPDVVVEKTAGTPVVTAGDDVSFTVAVSNTGTGDANDVVLTDDLPDGVEWTIDPPVEGCEIAGNVLTCDFGTLASGASVAVTLTGTTDAADCGILTNTAAGTASNESDDDQANNSGTAEITVDCPDVVVSKTAGSQTVVAGEDATFTITVSNTGEGEARNVVLTDELPAGIDWVIDPAVEGCAITDGTLDCTFATLAAGESISVTLVGATDATDCGLVTNLASATADNEADGDTGNNSDRASQLVLCSNLRVIKTAETDVVTATDPVSFTIEVQNIGLGRADNVELVDELPEEFSPWTIDPAVEGCEIGGDGITLTCDIGSLERGESFAVTVVGETDTEDCGIIANEATASASNEPDFATGNNSDEAEIQVLCSEMVVTKSASNGVVSAGDDVSYTITATNLGEGIAYNVIVTDDLPTGLEWSESPDNPNCEITDGVTLNCDFGDLATGESVSVTVTATTDAADCGVLANRATVESSSDDAGNDPLNNQSSLVEIEVLCPDIVVGKTAGTPVVSAGDDVSYTVTVANIGEGIAYDVEVTDELPAGIEWTIDPAVDGCAITDGTLDCSFATLAAGESIDITVTGTTDSADCGILANTASGTASNEDDSDSGNNSDSANITIDCPDVVVEKTAGSQTVVAGEDVSFTITVSNTGAGNAYNVTVTDDLPNGIEWAIDPAVDGCAITDGSLECSFAVLAAGESVDITITGTTDAEDCGLVTNLAEASADNEADDATDNNSDRANLLVLCANLRVLKVADPGEVTATDPVSFTIEVRNIGLGRADNVQLVDELPAELAPWTIDPAVEGCEITDGVLLACDIGSLARGETFSVTVVGTSDTDDCGVIANEASATADNEANEDTDNNTDDAEVQILCAEMRVTKSASSGVVSAGDDVSYTITVDNQGDGPAYNTVVTDELPAGVEWTIDPSVEGCAIDGADPQLLTCDLGTLPVGESVPITVVGTTDAADCGVLANRAEVESSSDDANNDISNTESRLVEIEVLCPDILVEKTAGTDVVSAGDDVSFTIAVTNTGEGIATDVTVEDQLPAGIVWTIDPPVDGCAIAGAMLECAFETVGPLETIEITVTGTTDAADCGVLTNTASGTASNESEDATGNNSGTAEITVDCPDIVIEKTTTTPVVSAGDEVNFTVTVSNIGEGTAYDVIVSDELPAGIFWAESPDNPDCSISADGLTLTCEIAELASGASSSVTLTGTTDAANCGVLPNTANAAASNESDDDQANNSATAEVTVDCPDVVVEKTAQSLTVVAGEEASFTITVSNIGEGTAHNVVVTDELPAGIDWEIEPAVDNCGIADGSLSCEFDTLAPGESIDITVVGATSAENCGLITNLASAIADNEADEATENNSDRATLRVNCPDVRVIKIADTPEVTATDAVSFTINVQNVGFGRADNVQLVDTLPADLAPWTIDPAVDGCAIADDGVTLTCDIGTLERGESFAVTVTATTDTEDCGIIQNLATASADNEPDSASMNNSDSAEIQVLCSEMVVTKSASSGVVSAGEDVSYTITATNLDEGIAYNVIVTDELPAGLEWSESPDNPACEIAGSTLTCDFGDLATGESASVTVSATTDAEDCGMLSNRALVESSSDDAGDDIRDNQSRLVEIEVDCADIIVEKTTSTPTVSAGGDVNFTITVSNAGPGEAHDVAVTDDLPDGIEWTIDPEVEGCAITDGTLECSFDSMTAGQAIDITITGTTTAVDCGVLTNTAIGQASNEPSGDDDDNNSGTAEIEVDCPDILVEKVAPDTDLTVGDEVSFTIAVTNIGEGNAYDVVVTDPLPEGFNWDVTGDYAEDCTSEGGELVCTIPVLGPGETAEIVVSAPTTTSNCGIVENTASGTASNEPDDATDNNESSADVTIVCPEPSPSPTPSPTPTVPDDDKTPTPDDGTKTPTPEDPSTPISVLPETGTGDSGGGLGLTVWAQIAAAIIALAAAIAMGQGSFRRGTTRDDS